MNHHHSVLYQTDSVKGKSLDVDAKFIEDAIRSFARRFSKRPNRIYTSVLIDKDFGMEHIIDDKMYPYQLFVGHTEDIEKIHYGQL